MQEYYGTKKIQAERNRGPQPEGADGYTVLYSDGYRSWSPRAAFEEAYRESGRLNFGHALAAMKEGRKLARKGWNGNGLYVYYVPAVKDNDGNGPSYRAYFEIVAPSGIETNTITTKTVSKWVPSVGDVDAEDWFIVE
jgi:hypothetical protein